MPQLLSILMSHRAINRVKRARERRRGRKKGRGEKQSKPARRAARAEHQVLAAARHRTPVEWAST
jgi:hypothetical protein